MSDPFRRKDPDRERQVEIEREVRNNLNELSRVAKDILLDQRYSQFADLVRDAEENTFELLLQMHKNNVGDRLKKYDEYLVELNVYRNILNSVSDLSQPDKAKQQKVSYVQKFKKDVSEFLNRIS